MSDAMSEAMSDDEAMSEAMSDDEYWPLEVGQLQDKIHRLLSLRDYVRLHTTCLSAASLDLRYRHRHNDSDWGEYPGRLYDDSWNLTWLLTSEQQTITSDTWLHNLFEASKNRSNVRGFITSLLKVYVCHQTPTFPLVKEAPDQLTLERSCLGVLVGADCNDPKTWNEVKKLRAFRGYDYRVTYEPRSDDICAVHTEHIEHYSDDSDRDGWFGSSDASASDRDGRFGSSDAFAIIKASPPRPIYAKEAVTFDVITGVRDQWATTLAEVKHTTLSDLLRQALQTRWLTNKDTVRASVTSKALLQFRSSLAIFTLTAVRGQWKLEKKLQNGLCQMRPVKAQDGFKKMRYLTDPLTGENCTVFSLKCNIRLGGLRVSLPAAFPGEGSETRMVRCIEGHLQEKLPWSLLSPYCPRICSNCMGMTCKSALAEIGILPNLPDGCFYKAATSLLYRMGYLRGASTVRRVIGRHVRKREDGHVPADPWAEAAARPRRDQPTSWHRSDWSAASTWGAGWTAAAGSWAEPAAGGTGWTPTASSWTEPAAGSRWGAAGAGADWWSASPGEGAVGGDWQWGSWSSPGASQSRDFEFPHMSANTCRAVETELRIRGRIAYSESLEGLLHATLKTGDVPGRRSLLHGVGTQVA